MLYALPPAPATLLELLEDCRYEYARTGMRCKATDPETAIPWGEGRGYLFEHYRLNLGGRRSPRLSDEGYEG